MAFTFDIDGRGRVPAGKIVAVAKNYEEHRREMAGILGSGAAGDENPPEDPVVFLKPATSLVGDGGSVVIPRGVVNVHYETELAVVVGDVMRNVAEERALAYVAGYAVALDMTARDLQARAKRLGMPWTLSKGFDTFCPISAVAPAGLVLDPHAVVLELRVNGELRQRGSTRDMVHRVDELLAFVSRFMTLEAGDVLLTGTPAGVGPVKPGDRLEANAEGVGTLRVDVAQGDR